MNEKFKLLRNPDRIVLSDVFHSIKVEKVSLCGLGFKCSYLGGGPKMSNVRCEVNSGLVREDVRFVQKEEEELAKLTRYWSIKQFPCKLGGIF